MYIKLMVLIFLFTSNQTLKLIAAEKEQSTEELAFKHGYQQCQKELPLFIEDINLVYQFARAQFFTNEDLRKLTPLQIKSIKEKISPPIYAAIMTIQTVIRQLPNIKNVRFSQIGNKEKIDFIQVLFPLCRSLFNQIYVIKRTKEFSDKELFNHILPGFIDQVNNLLENDRLKINQLLQAFDFMTFFKDVFIELLTVKTKFEIAQTAATIPKDLKSGIYTIPAALRLQIILATDAQAGFELIEN